MDLVAPTRGMTDEESRERDGVERGWLVRMSRNFQRRGSDQSLSGICSDDDGRVVWRRGSGVVVNVMKLGQGSFTMGVSIRES